MWRRRGVAHHGDPWFRPSVNTALNARVAIGDESETFIPGGVEVFRFAALACLRFEFAMKGVAGAMLQGIFGNNSMNGAGWNRGPTHAETAPAGAVVSFRKVRKEYRTGEVTVQALRGVTFDVLEGELLVILGPSGSGKSTLLNLLGGLDRPTEGSILFKGADITRFSEAELTRYRRLSVGFIFQAYNLLPDLTARENVDLARELAENPLPTDEVLRKVGLSDRADHFPSQLSGGEQQRVAIARAVAKNPELLLCDEPTGALDHETGKQVLKLLREINREFGRTVLLITHNSAVAAMGDRVLRLRSGEVAAVQRNEHPLDPEDIEW